MPPLVSKSKVTVWIGIFGCRFFILKKFGLTVHNDSTKRQNPLTAVLYYIGLRKEAGMPESITYNCDCMEYMRTLPDKSFDLAVVDPPYGGGGADNEYKGAVVGRFGGRFEKYHLATEITAERRGHGHNKYDDGELSAKHWDYAPPPEYFQELARVSKNQIIWGENYFDLPPTRCFLVWRKLTISESFTMSMAEYAWTSFNDNAKVFEFAPQGKKGDTRFHPTQKPIELYEWVFRLFAKQGDKILDTHLGSGSSRIAAHEAGLDFVGCEIDPVYYELEEQRFEKFVSQRSIFEADYGAAEQTGLWEDL